MTHGRRPPTRSHLKEVSAPPWDHQELLLPLRYKIPGKTPGTETPEKADRGSRFLRERLRQHLSDEAPGSHRSVVAATCYDIFSFP